MSPRITSSHDSWAKGSEKLISEQSIQSEIQVTDRGSFDGCTHVRDQFRQLISVQKQSERKKSVFVWNYEVDEFLGRRTRGIYQLQQSSSFTRNHLDVCQENNGDHKNKQIRFFVRKMSQPSLQRAASLTKTSVFTVPGYRKDCQERQDYRVGHSKNRIVDVLRQQQVLEDHGSIRC